MNRTLVFLILFTGFALPHFAMSSQDCEKALTDIVRATPEDEEIPPHLVDQIIDHLREQGFVFESEAEFARWYSNKKTGPFKEYIYTVNIEVSGRTIHLYGDFLSLDIGHGSLLNEVLYITGYDRLDGIPFERGIFGISRNENSNQIAIYRHYQTKNNVEYIPLDTTFAKDPVEYLNELANPK